MNNLEATTAAIHRALKPNGLFMSVSPLSIPDLFDFRQRFINNSGWASSISGEGRLLKNFH
jgi:enhancing lycopene biosynthesis protein 2